MNSRSLITGVTCVVTVELALIQADVMYLCRHDVNSRLPDVAEPGMTCVVTVELALLQADVMYL